VSVPAPVGYAYVVFCIHARPCTDQVHSHPSEPQCSYDPVDGLTLAPDTDPVEKIKQLEDEICASALSLAFLCLTPAVATLKAQLFEQSMTATIHSNDAQHPHGSRRDSDAGNIALPQASLALMNLIATDHPDTRFRSASNSPELRNVSVKTSADPFMDLLFSGWNPDLPDPATLNH